MTKRKRMTVLTIVMAAVILVFIAVSVFVAVMLRPLTFTCSDGTTVNGWRWGDQVYLSADVFAGGQDVAIDAENLTITYSDPVDPEQVRADTAEVLTLQFAEDTTKAQAQHDAAVETLEAQIEELQAQLDEPETEPSGNGGTSGTGGGTGNSSGSGAGNSGGSGGSSSGGGAQAPSPQTPSSPSPATTPEPAPAPAPAPAAPTVDAGACIAAARAHGLSLGMTEDGRISIGGAGYLNPPDITVLTQENVIASLIYCLNQYASYSPDDPSLVHFNIVQSGNLIYALYQ